jgi:hypothetical protein
VQARCDGHRFNFNIAGVHMKPAGENAYHLRSKCATTLQRDDAERFLRIGTLQKRVGNGEELCGLRNPVPAQLIGIAGSVPAFRLPPNHVGGRPRQHRRSFADACALRRNIPSLHARHALGRTFTFAKSGITERTDRMEQSCEVQCIAFVRIASGNPRQ